MQHYHVSHETDWVRIGYRTAGAAEEILLLDFVETLMMGQHLAFQAEIGNAVVLNALWRGAQQSNEE